jgi:hypothetical protein
VVPPAAAALKVHGYFVGDSPRGPKAVQRAYKKFIVIKMIYWGNIRSILGFLTTRRYLESGVLVHAASVHDLLASTAAATASLTLTRLLLHTEHQLPIAWPHLLGICSWSWFWNPAHSVEIEFRAEPTPTLFVACGLSPFQTSIRAGRRNGTAGKLCIPHTCRDRGRRRRKCQKPKRRRRAVAQGRGQALPPLFVEMLRQGRRNHLMRSNRVAVIGSTGWIGWNWLELVL